MSNSMPIEQPAPTVKRRLISMVYELLLAFAVLFLPFLIFEIVSGASHTPVAEHMRQMLAFLVLGAYFIHQWVREGQTLAMRTWRIKVVLPGHAHVPPKIAALRYLLSWGWVLPALVVDYAFGLSRWQALNAIGAGILAWALTAFFNKDRQFLHDRIAGTRLVQLPKPAEKGKEQAAT
ncbi:RDD family protein [Massilia sp. FT127W]|uniref:RDD family protein n=2 Tax=Pseudoduganella aquatica TaxID=2660641 RepID=A0A7X4HAG7_9BURK|nr:RDD family protein [Pseudoduganella aquatica]